MYKKCPETRNAFFSHFYGYLFLTPSIYKMEIIYNQIKQIERKLQRFAIIFNVGQIVIFTRLGIVMCDGCIKNNLTIITTGPPHSKFRGLCRCVIHLECLSPQCSAPGVGVCVRCLLHPGNIISPSPRLSIRSIY